jgi:hypothetical protein
VRGAELTLGGLKQRAVFALMALNAGRVVALDRLVDELWEGEPPSRATLGLQSYMARLRRSLAPLEPIEVAALVRDLSGADAASEVVSAVHSRTAGNPLFIRELVLLLSSERRLEAEGVLSTLPRTTHSTPARSCSATTSSGRRWSSPSRWPPGRGRTPGLPTSCKPADR